MPNPDITVPPPPPAVDGLTPAWQSLAATGARWALTALAGFLVSKGVTDPTQSGALVEVGTGVLVGALALGWSLVQKWLAKKALVTALALPSGSTLTDLAKVVKVPL